MHSGVEERQTNATNVILFGASGFGEHLETHSGENSNKWDDSLHSGEIENLHFWGNWFLKEFEKHSGKEKQIMG